MAENSLEQEALTEKLEQSLRLDQQRETTGRDPVIIPISSFHPSENPDLGQAFQVNRTGHKLGFDPYKKGSPTLAWKHRSANKIRNLLSSQTEQVEQCECCGMPIDAPQFSLCTNVNNLGELGPGFPMYYLNVKFLFCVLLLGFCMVGLPCMIDNIQQDRADQWDEDVNIAIQSSAGGQGDNDHILPFWQSVLHVIYMFLVLIAYHLWRRFLIKKEEEIDMSIITPSDYTVMVSGLPKVATEQQVKQFFEQNGRADNTKAKVLKVNFAYKIRQYIQDIRELQQWKQKLRLIQEYQKDHPGQLPKQKFLVCFKKNIKAPQKIARKILKLNEQIKKFEQETEVGVGRDLLSGIAFVTFETQVESRLVQKRFGKDFIQWSWDVISNLLCPKLGSNKNKKFFFKGNSIHANIAPEPSDIFWENLGTSITKKIWKILKTDTAVLLALGASFVLVYGCSFWQDEIYDDYQNTPKEDRSVSDEWNVRINSIIPAFFIVIINFLLGKVIRYFSAFERHQTITDFNSSVAMKLILSQFLNTAVIALVVNFQLQQSWFIPGGLVIDMIFIFLSMAFVQPIVYLTNPTFCLKRILIKRAAKDQYINQGDINQVFEAPPVDIAQRYANLMKTLLVTVFYVPIIPVAFFISAIGVFVQFWVQKYVLLRRHSRPSRLSGDLALTVITLIPFAILLYAVMLNFYMEILNPEQARLSFVWMIIVICYIFIPIEMIFGWFKKTDIEAFEQEYADKPYQAVAMDFFDDYDRENPVTQNEGWKAYFQMYGQEGELGMEDKDSIQTLLAQSLGIGSIKNNLKNYANNKQSLGKFGKKETRHDLVTGLLGNNLVFQNQESEKKVDQNQKLKEIFFRSKPQNPLNSYGKTKYRGKLQGVEQHFMSLVKKQSAIVVPVAEETGPGNTLFSMFKR